MDALEAWIREEPIARLRIVMAAVTLLTALPLLIFAAYLWRLGSRVLSAGQFPPPGYRVMRATAPVTGPAALRRARLAQVSAALLGVASAIFVFVLWRLTLLLENGFS